MIRDSNKMTREEIINKPGYLSAKIVFNTLYDNKFDLFFIGNIMGNSLYTVQLNNNERALVGFTDEYLLKSYTNRNKINNMLRNMFGSKIVSVNMNICALNNLLYGKDNDYENVDLRTIVINPNDKDFFIPVHIDTLYKYIMNNNIIDEDHIDNQSQDNLRELLYDKEDKMYLFQEDDNKIF